MAHDNEPPEHLQTSADELHWLAFCYVAGELAAEECAAFEQRLGGDQRAREAVAAAVELAQCVLLSEGAVRSHPRPVVSKAQSAIGRAWLERAGWLLAGLAAGLLVMAMARSWRVDRQTDVPAEQSASALAAQWSELREQGSEVWEESVAGGPALGVAESTAGDPLEYDISDDSSEALLSPDWLIAALAEHETAEQDSPAVINQ